MPFFIRQKNQVITFAVMTNEKTEMGNPKGFIYSQRKQIIADFSTWDTKKLAQHAFELLKIIDDLKRENFNLNQKLEILIDLKEKKRKAEIEKKYNLNWPYPQKILYILTFYNRPIQIDVFLEYLVKNDFHFKKVKQKKNTLYGLLSRVHKKKEIEAITVNSVYKKFYVLSEWLDENKQLRKEYRDKIELF